MIDSSAVVGVGGAADMIAPVGGSCPKLSTRLQLRSCPVAPADVRVRRATPADADDILDVCSAALGWSNPAFDRALFTWKHIDNTFGPSLMLIAEDASGILAVRPLMQWVFTRAGETVRAARAVDTATRPDARGRGLFRALTQAGIAQLEEDGYGFIFNTPNASSQPGYLKMGWVDAGKVAFGFGIRGPASLPRIVRSRTPADKPSIETPDLGVSVAEGLATASAFDGSEPELRTAHSIESLLWRYERGPITYRWIATADQQGCIVRLRQRGASRELVVAESLTAGTSSDGWSIVREAMHQVDADYCVTPAGFGASRSVAKLGPTLTLRSIAENPTHSRFTWSPGDIELF